jgi:LuxR family transcriptional regulator, maltose regulon positive regulatory protein
MPGWAKAQTLLRTKFAVPRGPKAAVVRARLLDRLDAGVEAPLTLVAAPAGAGKSALLSSWIAARRAPGPVAWLSLDVDDADRRRFWRAVLATVAKATADKRIESLAVSPRDPVDLDVVLPALVDALTGREEPVVLVLDDFHEVADAVQEDLERMVRFPPPALRLVIGTRADPPIGLGRLRLDGSLAEIRANDLAFTLDEASALFDGLGVPIAAANLATLWRRTEGWAAGLTLAALSVQAHPEPQGFIDQFAGTDATVSDYLVSEVLARQPPELRDFLLRTSLVDPISAELADALTGRSDGQQLLARLEHGGALLAPLDDQGVWHRYHPLFAQLLQAELHAQLQDELGELHRRAARWLADHDDDAGALRHAAAGQAWDLAAELVIDRWVTLLIDGEMGALRPVLDAMPRERIRACPELALAFAGSLLASGHHELAEPHLRIAEKGERQVPRERRAQFAATMAAVGLYDGRFRGDPSAALDAARKLMERGPDLDGEVTVALRGLVLTQLGIVELWTGDIEGAIGHLERAHAVAVEGRRDWTVLVAAAHLAIAAAFRGEVARALRRANEAIALAERRGWTRAEPAGAAYLVLGTVCVQRNQLDEADRFLASAGAALEGTRERPLLAAHALNRAMALSDRGQHDAALDVLQAGREQLGDWPLLAPMRDMLAAEEGLLRTATGEREAGRAALERAHERDRGSLPVANALARLQLLDGDPHAARETLGTRREHRREGNGAALSTRAESWLLDAIALDALAEHDAAARSLERALDLAEPAGLRRLIITHGSVVRPLLQRHARRGTAHPALVGEMLEVVERRGRGDSRPVSTLLTEPLSERERAILRYLPTMMSNQEIAGELFVSVNTVKTHLKAIYRKLDAPGRREAVTRAREHGLIP